MIHLYSVHLDLRNLVTKLNVKVVTFAKFQYLYDIDTLSTTAGFYCSMVDTICLNENYDPKYVDSTWTLCHELIHWTGHKDRLNRKGVTDNWEIFQFLTKDEKDKEELIAELGAFQLFKMFELDNSLIKKSINEWKVNMNKETIKLAQIEADIATAWIFNEITKRKTG